MGNTSVRAPDALINAAKEKGINLSEVFRVALEVALEDRVSEQGEVLRRINHLMHEQTKIKTEVNILKLKLKETDT